MNLLSDSSDAIRTWSETLFTWVKIAALVAIGGWTLYQWDRTIFPKEQHDQMLRAAVLSPDLLVRDQELSVKTLYLSPASKADYRMASEAEFPALLTYSARLSNTGSLPVRLTGKEVVFETQQLTRDTRQVEWTEVARLDFATAFGAWVAEGKTVMPGNDVILAGTSITGFSWCCSQGLAGRDLRLTRVSAAMTLHTIDPSTGAPVEGSETPKDILIWVVTSGKDPSLTESLSGTEQAEAPAAPERSRVKAGSGAPRPSRPVGSGVFR